MRNRAVAVAFAALLLILIVVAVKGCRDNARKNALRDYNRDVADLVGQSQQEVAKPFFDLLAGDKSNPNRLQTTINQYKVTAEDEADRARDLNTPSAMAGAQRNFVTVLDFRAEALAKIADKIRSVYGDANVAGIATEQIAGQMQKLLASDIIFSQRVGPLISQALADNDVSGDVPSSSFLPDLGWLSPQTVASRLGSRGGGPGTNTGGPIAPGLHGHGLDSVSAGATTLQPAPAANRIAASASLAFNVKFTNGGVNNESDVGVTVTITGGPKKITVKKSVDQTIAGQQATISVPLGQTPPTGTPVTITVSIAKVPGEMKLDNNRQSYTAIFTR